MEQGWSLLPSVNCKVCSARPCAAWLRRATGGGRIVRTAPGKARRCRRSEHTVRGRGRSRERLRRRPSLVGHQRLGQEKLETELDAIALQAVRQPLEHAQSLGRPGRYLPRDWRRAGSPACRPSASCSPPAWFFPACAQERRFKGHRNAGVESLARGPKQELIGDVLHQRVLEPERRVQPGCFPERQRPCDDELVEKRVKLRVRPGRRRRPAGMAELAADHRADLCSSLARPSRSRRARRARHGAWSGCDAAPGVGEIAGAAVSPASTTALAPLFDEKRHAVGTLKDFLDEVVGEGRRCRQSVRRGRRWRTGSAGLRRACGRAAARPTAGRVGRNVDKSRMGSCGTS